MIRSLHRRFLWNAYLWACVFLLIVMLIAVGALARYMDTILSTALNDTLRLGVSDPATPAVSARMRIPTYLAVIRQAAPNPEATSLKEGDTVELLRGDLADWTEEEIRKDADEDLSNYDIWMLIMWLETTTTTNSSASQLADYYQQLAYYSYYNQLYGNSYSNYYNYMLMAQYAGANSSTTTSSSELDKDRYYNCVLHGPASEDRKPKLKITFALPKE